MAIEGDRTHSSDPTEYQRELQEERILDFYATDGTLPEDFYTPDGHLLDGEALIRVERAQSLARSAATLGMVGEVKVGDIGTFVYDSSAARPVVWSSAITNQGSI